MLYTAWTPKYVYCNCNNNLVPCCSWCGTNHTSPKACSFWLAHRWLMLGSCGWLSPRGHHNGGSAFLIWKETNQCNLPSNKQHRYTVMANLTPMRLGLAMAVYAVLHKRKWFTLRYHNLNMVCITPLGHLSFTLYVEWVTDCQTQLITAKLWLIQTKMLVPWPKTACMRWSGTIAQFFWFLSVWNDVLQASPRWNLRVQLC